MFRRCLVGFVVVCGSVVAACGDSKDPGDDDARAGAQGQTGGASSAGHGGTTSGGGTSGAAGSSLTQARYAACAEYIRVQCSRRTACDPAHDQAHCLELGTSYCPDLHFSKASNATLGAVERCARLWQEATCQELNSALYPDCALEPGDLPAGASCAFSTECASSTCGEFDARGCGRCLTTGTLGGACGGNVGCPRGARCDESRCVPAPVRNLPLGSACETVFQCGAGNVCRLAATGDRNTCQPLVSTGSPCEASWECEPDAYCAGVCTKSPPAGSPCADDGWRFQRGCAADSACDQTGATPMCRLRVPSGAACQVSGDENDLAGNCQANLSCVCNAPGCTARQCRRVVFAGEGCADAESACVLGATCENGVCVGGEVEDRLPSSCGG